MHWLKQSTAIDVRIGPAMDATDGVTPETTLALGTADQAEALKHDGAATVDISSNTFAAVTGCDGWYDLTLTTTDTNTLGQLDIVIQDSSLMAPLFRSFMVVPANVWDSMFGSDKLEVDMVAQGGLTLETGTAQAGATGSITLASGASSVTDFYKGSRVVIVAGTGVKQGGIVEAYNGTTKVATMADNWATTPSTDSVYLIIPVGVSIVDTANPLPAQVVDITTAGQGDIRTALGMSSADLDTQLDAIVADTGELQTDWANGGRLDLLIDGILEDTGTTLPGIFGTPGNLGSGATLANNLSDMAGGTFSGSTDSLEALRDRGDAAWTTGAGGTPPDLLQTTTIATLTSQTVFTLTAGSADDNAYNGHIIIVTDQSTSTQKAVGTVSDYVGSTKEVTLASDPGVFTMAVGDTADVVAATGSGLDAAGVRAAIGMASADMDTQLDAIVADTNELQTDWVNGGRLDLLIDQIISDISALPNAAAINAEVVDALNVDTYAEPSAIPAATASLAAKIGILTAVLRNKVTLNSTTGVMALRNDADTADIATSTASDDGTTTTLQEWA